MINKVVIVPGLVSKVLGGIGNAAKAIGKAALSAFNPFKDDEYRRASPEERVQFQDKIEVIANDKNLDHEYRMEAKRVLLKIESFRHAEELARIEGTTKITIAHIEATKDVVMAKIDVLKANIVGGRSKEIALIEAMGRSPQLADSFLERLDNTAVEIKEIENNLTVYSQEMTNLTNMAQINNTGIPLFVSDAKLEGKKKD
tara:strand:+ start:4107 stop:4709 length:603 start_codon:yes stop_codon:yes gene_type:complete